jgi:type 1 glutamine amidotransferase
LFTFAKAADIETIVTSGAPEGLPGLDKLAREFGVNVAFEGSNPQTLVSSLNGLSSRIGVSMDTAAWAKAGIKPADGLRLVNDRLLGLSLADATGTDQLLLDLAKLNPPPAPPPVTCGDCAGPKVPVRPLFITIAANAAAIAAYEKATRPAEGYQIIQISKKTPISDGHIGPAPSAGSPNLTDGGIPVLDRWMIRDASPRQALVAPKKARKLLILDICPQGGFYHRTIPYANLALEYMAKNTGAFEAVFDNDLDNLKYPKIKEYDAVFLNSLVGSVFTDQDVINGLIRYVREGGGLAAIHGTTFASTDVPEFGELLGATTAPHRALEPAMLKIDDPDSPIMKQFEGHSISWIDELYHFPPSGPYSRDKLHVLLSIDIARSGTPAPNLAVRPDNDYGLVWIKNEGKGRVFNCALGHSVLLFGTPQTAQMILNAIQYVLGDLDADATPSAKLATKK